MAVSFSVGGTVLPTLALSKQRNSKRHKELGVCFLKYDKAVTAI